MGNILKPGDTFPREFGCFIVSKRTRKAITIYSPGSTGRFAGKKYQYRFDGLGFKRQGQYLRRDGTIKEIQAGENLALDAAS